MTSKPTPKILVTGANGQIGQVLCAALRERYGNDQVLASDIQNTPGENEPFKFLDILNPVRLHEIIYDYGITQIYHLAAILSAHGEWNPLKTWNVNFNGLMDILEAARQIKQIDKVFFPSTIAVFGKTTPLDQTPQDVPMTPETVYGMSKVAGELWCNYYYQRYGVDVRSVRYPGIIGHESMPGGGTTDYAVEIYHEAVKGNNYECFLSENTYLPMMYMDDALRATINLMEAPKEDIKIRTSYNLSGMSFSPKEVAENIQKYIPSFEITYKPDERQKIADSWTHSIDDSRARQDWNWSPKYDIDAMTQDMIKHLKLKYNA